MLGEPLNYPHASLRTCVVDHFQLFGIYESTGDHAMTELNRRCSISPFGQLALGASAASGLPLERINAAPHTFTLPVSGFASTHKPLWSTFLCVVPELEVVENAESDEICHYNLLRSTFALNALSAHQKHSSLLPRLDRGSNDCRRSYPS